MVVPDCTGKFHHVNWKDVRRRAEAVEEEKGSSQECVARAYCKGAECDETGARRIARRGECYSASGGGKRDGY